MASWRRINSTNASPSPVSDRPINSASDVMALPRPYILYLPSDRPKRSVLVRGPGLSEACRTSKNWQLSHGTSYSAQIPAELEPETGRRHVGSGFGYRRRSVPIHLV